MNGNDRRRMELLHPEMIPTSEERKRRKEIVETIVGVCNGISISFMLLGMLIVIFVSTQFMGVTGFWIAFLGILLDVIIGGFIAYNLGNKMTKRFTERYLTNKIV